MLHTASLRFAERIAELTSVENALRLVIIDRAHGSME